MVSSASEATSKYQLIAFEAIDSNIRDISHEEFSDIRKALFTIESVILIEESYDAIVANYRTFETRHYQLALEGVLDRSHSYLAKSDGRRSTALDLNNLLSTARSFLDITSGRFRLIGGKKLQDTFKSATSREYDENISYQFMEELRNYTQHRGSSIDAIWWNRNRAVTAEAYSKSTLIHSITPSIDAAELDSHFKAKRHHLLAALSDQKGRILVTPLVRSYMASLSAVMLSAREAISEEESSAWETCKKAMATLACAGAYGFRLRRYEHGRTVDDLSLPTRRDGLIESLRDRNGTLSHLPRTQIHL